MTDSYTPLPADVDLTPLPADVDHEVVINILDKASPPSPDGTMAELLHTAFPDIEEVFSVEELLKLWSEFEDGEKLASIDEAGE